jgi:hypothetical protein
VELEVKGKKQQKKYKEAQSQDRYILCGGDQNYIFRYRLLQNKKAGSNYTFHYLHNSLS